MSTERLIRLPEVMRMTGKRKTAIYDAIAKGTFPRSIPLGHRTSVWVESEVQAWIAGVIQQHRAA